MDPVAVAAIGAGFGVVASLITTVATTTMTRRFSRHDSAREQDRAAAERASEVMLRLLQLPRHPDEDQRPGETLEQAIGRKSDAASQKEWEGQYAELLLALRTIALDFSDPAVRARMAMVHLILTFHSDYWYREGQVEPRTRYIACNDALECLGSVRRGEPLPAPSTSFQQAANSAEDYQEFRELESKGS